ncbi:MAG: MFS transporter [Anaerolineae bacterium]|nr:MFS transporter [Anaerolineae bacterium]
MTTSQERGALAPDLRRLAADHPEYIAGLEERQRWNFGWNMLDYASFSITKACLNENTVIPYYISQLTANAVIIGLLPAIAWLGLYVPQIIAAWLVHSRDRYKSHILTWAWGERVGILLIFAAAMCIGVFSPPLVLAFFLFAYFFFWVTAGLLIPPYQAFFARHIPTLRPTFFGMQVFLSGALGLLGSLAVRWRLDSAPFPGDLQSVIGIALLISIPSMVAIHTLREVPYPTPPRQQTLPRYLEAVPVMLREHPVFVRFLIGRVFIALAKLGTPFMAVYAVSRFELTSGVIATYTAIMLVAQSLSGPLWTALGRRIGWGRIWLLNVVLISALSAAAWLAPSPGWFYGVFALLGLTIGAELMGQPSTVFQLSPPEETSRFISLSNLVVGPSLALGPVVGGWLANTWGYPAALAAGTVMALVSIPVVYLFVTRPMRRYHTV